MNIPCVLSKVLILLGAACLLWIGMISVGLAVVMGTGVSMGWIVAGVLVVTLVICGLAMSREIRNAVVLPESYSEDSLEEAFGWEVETISAQSSNHSVGTSWQAQCRPMWSCPSMPRQSRNRPRMRSGVLQSELRCPRITRSRWA